MGQKCTSLNIFPVTKTSSPTIRNTFGCNMSKTDQNESLDNFAVSANTESHQHFESIYNSNVELPTASDLLNLPCTSTSDCYKENLSDFKCQSSSMTKHCKKRSANSKKKKKKHEWILKFNRSRHKCNSSNADIASEEDNSSWECISHHLTTPISQPIVEPNVTQSEPSGSDPVIDLSKFNPEEYPIEDCDERARLERAREIAEGVDPPPGFSPTQPVDVISHTDVNLNNLKALLQSALSLSALSQIDVPKSVHSQVDYIHCLVPDLLKITSCSFYWGKMDRYEAEKLLENKPEGTFLLRDSAHEEFLYSVSFRKYGRSLHARIEQWNHRFSFDSHDPGVFSSNTVCGLIEHYKDPTCCMFFEPTLTTPLHRNFTFSLQHLCRAVICDHLTYDSITYLRLPKPMKFYLKEYHYMQRLRVRKFESES